MPESSNLCLNDINKQSDEYLQSPVRMCPIKSTCSIEDSDSDETDHKATLCTPELSIQSTSALKRTRLSLSQSWKNKIIAKKMRNLKRRKLLDETDCTSGFASDEEVRNVMNIPSMSSKIAELESSIVIWRKGCIEALKDLLEKSNHDSMESLLDMLGIPHKLLQYDNSEQIFLDPD